MAALQEVGRRLGRRSLVGSVLLILVGALLIPIGFSVLHTNAEHRKLYTSQTSGVVDSGAYTEKIHGGRHPSYSCHLSAHYEVASKSYKEDFTTENKCHDSEKSGAKRPIFYDPQDPYLATIDDPNSTGAFFAPIVSWLIGTGGIALGVFLLYLRRKNRREEGDPQKLILY